jgi:exosortase/archaeosortase family protein
MNTGGRGRSPRLTRRQTVVSVFSAVGVLGLLVFLSQSAGSTSALRRMYAVVTGFVVNAFGANAVVRGTDIVSAQFSISVVTACTGLFVTGLFLVAVVAFPTSWRSRLVGAALGIAGLFFVNVVRLASLFYVGIHWPGILDVVHQLVWQSLVIVIAVSLWLLWAGRSASAKAVAGRARS